MASIDASTTAIGGLIQTYKYEPFLNTFQLNSNAVAGSSLTYARSSTELFQFLSTPDTSSVVFTSLNGPNTSYSADLRLVVDELSASVIYNTVSNSVRISPGRFTDPASNSVFTLYKNEPLSNTFPTDAGIRFVGSIPINQPITSPSLPIGVSWQRDSSTVYRLVGTPTIQTLTSNYNVIGTDVCGGRTISVRANFAVNGERMLVDLSGSSTISNLAVGTAIASRGVTIRVPPYSPTTSNKVRYTWTPSLPDGFSFRDAYGNLVSNGGITPDASSSLILVGTPTSNMFRTLGNVPYQVLVTATRTISPFLTRDVSFVFAGSETILFNVPNIQPSFYTHAPISASAFSNSFKAQTQFAVGVDSSIAQIFSPNLRSDLSLVFLSNLQRADLSGTPVGAGSGTYTIRAVNGNGTVGDLSATIVVNNDTIVFDSNVTPTTDVCYSFIVGRSLANPKPGYSDKSRRFRAIAQSQTPITMTATPLDGTGISFVSVGSNTYELSGTPIATSPLQTLTVSAVSTVTGATASTTTTYNILPDRYTFNNVSLQFVQNFPISPVQFQATALSGLPVLSYSSANVPSGLTLSSSGRLTGTFLPDTSSSITIVASTGFTSDSSAYSYSVRSDSMILIPPSNAYTYLAGTDIPPIPITGFTYSGTTVSNFQFSNLVPQYGLTLDASTGILDGVLTDSSPPNDVLPSSSNFFVTARANILKGILPVTLTTSNPVVARSLLARNVSLAGVPELTMLASDSNLFNWQSNAVTLGSNGYTVPNYQVSEIQRKNLSLDSNVILAPAVITNPPAPGHPAIPARVYRATANGSVFAAIDTSALDNVSSLTNKPGTSTWWGIGAKVDLCTGVAVVARSDTDGITWGSSALVQLNASNSLYLRDSATDVSSTSGIFGTYYYTTAGSVIRYKDGVLLAGGAGHSNIAMLRSTDEGHSWSLPTGSLCSNAAEVATICVSAPSRWIAAGSSRYLTYDRDSTFTSGFFQDAITLTFSDDSGATWTDCSDGFNFAAYDVAYAAGMWFATGIEATEEPRYYPQLKYSSDGAMWSNVTQINNLSFPSFTLLKLVPPIGIGPIMYDGSNWNVLVCRNEAQRQFKTTLYTHPNSGDFATGWTAYTDVSGLSDLVSGSSVFSGAGRAVAWNGSIWVAVGNDSSGTGTILTSTDGASWYAVSGSTFSGRGSGVAWNGSLWVAVGEDTSIGGNTILTSTNGTTWSSVSGPTFPANGYGVAWNGSLWVAVGEDPVNTNQTILTSTNGTTWNLASGTTFPTYGYGVAWNGSLWVAVGDDEFSAGKTILTSTNGTTWNLASGTTFNTYGFGVAWNGSLWVAVGQKDDMIVPTILTSTNGTTWSAASGTLFTGRGAGVAWNGSVWVAVGYDGTGGGNTILTSADGTTWSPVSGTIFTGAGSGIAWNGSVWVAVGYDGTGGGNTILTSADGITWHAVSAGSSSRPDARLPVPYVGFLPNIYTRTGTPISATLTFNAFVGRGPTITSPADTTLLFYQYMRITPIVFAGIGAGPIYFFLDATTLPIGLSWNPLTNTISGTPVRTGPASFTVYARDSNGITIVRIQTNTIVPRIVRKQDGAGAYTSLLRQYTLVNAAQNARDNRVFPNQERSLGEFMAPSAPDVVTPSNCSR